jgi:hypothetical protein
MFLKSFLKSKSVQAFALTAAVGMVGATAAPRRAEAMIGLASQQIEFIVMGGLAIASGFGLALSSSPARSFDAIGIMLVAFGLVILDAEDPTSLRFQALSAQNRITIGVSEADYRVYASELEEINAAWDEAARQALRAEVQTAEQARAYFDREFAALSPETRTVMSQVVRHAVR